MTNALIRGILLLVFVSLMYHTGQQLMKLGEMVGYTKGLQDCTCIMGDSK